MRTSFLLFCCIILLDSLSLSAQDPRWGEWHHWGEQAGGYYKNPIIPSDYSDIDCIRVGDDYYAISSTFQFSPGMTILHSRDLVNWTIAGHAISDLTQIGENLNWDKMSRYGRGVWAGTIRHHKGRFYVFFGTPDEGFFMTSAPRVEGPWEALTCLLPEEGWDDCTVMWDETSGEAVFLGTHFKDGYKSYLFKMAQDGKSIDRSSAIFIHEGHGREASKLIKHEDWYYLIYSEHYGKGRYVVAKRAKSVFGPYEESRQLALPCSEAHEPNQGGIIQGRDGKWYFMTHHGRGDWGGRIASLLPVTWIDAWPVIGRVLPEKIGSMQWEAPMPIVLDEKLEIQKSDDFDSKTLPAQWQWNYQPRADYFSLDERPGHLRLKAYRPLSPNDLKKAGNTLTQRVFQKESNDVRIKLDISQITKGLKCGLCHFSTTHSTIGVAMENGIKYIEFTLNKVSTRGPVLEEDVVWLRSEWGLDGLSRYSYSTDGVNYIPLGEPYPMVWGHYRGDRIGIFCYNNDSDSGYVDVDYFHYTD